MADPESLTFRSLGPPGGGGDHHRRPIHWGRRRNRPSSDFTAAIKVNGRRPRRVHNASARPGRRGAASTATRSSAWSRIRAATRFRAQLLSLRRVRSSRLSLAVHAGPRRPPTQAAAMAVPRRGAQAGRRDARQTPAIAPVPVLQIARRRAPGERAARSRRVLGVGACPGRRRRSTRVTVRQRARRAAGAFALAPDLSAHPRARHRLIACVVPTSSSAARPASALRLPRRTS